MSTQQPEPTAQSRSSWLISLGALGCALTAVATMVLYASSLPTSTSADGIAWCSDFGGVERKICRAYCERHACHLGAGDAEECEQILHVYRRNWGRDPTCLNDAT